MSFTLVGTKCHLCNQPIIPEEQGVYAATAQFTREAREGRGPNGLPYGGELEEVPEDRLRVVFRSAGLKAPVHQECWARAVDAFPTEAREDKDFWYMAGPFRVRNSSGLYLNAVNSWRQQMHNPGKLFGSVRALMSALTSIGNSLYYQAHHTFAADRSLVSDLLPEDWVVEDIGTHIFANARLFHAAQCRRPRS